MTKQKASTNRSKHSETEQRRRSKINERFQTLMDLIPQNDQKRDKASFLSEVIEYIQFLQEKLQMYEESQQMWSQGPTKLTPWRNNQRPAEDFIDHSQVIRSWSSHEKSVVPPPVLSDVPNSLESHIDSAAFVKALDQAPASATSLVPSHLKTETNMLISARGYMPAQPLLQSARHDSWQVRPSSESAAVNTNEQPNLKPESSVSSSTVYSQGVLNSLTEALQSSGVDLSRTTISVQLDVANRADHELTIAASASKDNDNQISDNQVGFKTGVESSYDEYDQAKKRVRR